MLIPGSKFQMMGDFSVQGHYISNSKCKGIQKFVHQMAMYS